MIVNKPRGKRRRAFTLVEMLVVVVIIGILASLITAAALRARTRARIALIVLEVSELDAACKAFKERFGEYPPDKIQYTMAFARKAFPRRTGANPPFPAQTPDAALVFWLGGMTGADGRPNGFSADPANPFDATAPGGIGPFFDFDASRLNGYTYRPPGVTGTTVPGYVYFRAENGDYTGKTSTTGARPMQDWRGTGTARPWMNRDSFQIRACGLDGLIGASDRFGIPSGYQAADYDDITNFSGGTLEDAIQQ